MKRLAILALCALVLSPLTAAEFSVSPEAAKELKVTRGRPFRTGLLFVDGKYIPPPYVVERYGNVLRINGIQVTGPLIPWVDFLRTQEGAVVTTEIRQPETATPSAPPEPQVAEAAPPAESSVDWDDPLVDLFDDDDSPVKKPSARKKVQPAPKPVARTPVSVTKVEFNGEFQMNDKAAALLNKLNRQRKVVDSTLRNGGFIFFGSSYHRVSGDSGAARQILINLPEVMKNSSDEEGFVASARARGLSFLPEPLLKDLFRNRLDCIKLSSRRKSMLEKERLDAMLKEVSKP